MPRATEYQCEICGATYSDYDSAAACEKKHVKPALFASYEYQHGGEYPSGIKVEMADDATRWYTLSEMAAKPVAGKAEPLTIDELKKLGVDNTASNRTEFDYVWLYDKRLSSDQWALTPALPEYWYRPDSVDSNSPEYDFLSLCLFDSGIGMQGKWNEYGKTWVCYPIQMPVLEESPNG